MRVEGKGEGQLTEKKFCFVLLACVAGTER